MAIDLHVLKVEINTDPEHLGYKEHVISGADSLIADIMNTIRPQFQVRESVLSSGDLQLQMMKAILQIDALSDQAKKTKWGRILAVIQSTEQVTLTDHGIQMLFAEAVKDGLLTDSEVSAIGTRPASRSEVLFGYNTVIHHGDVADALRKIKD